MAKAKVSAFRSKLPGATKHHNDRRCRSGHRIKPENRVSGKGGLPLCEACKRL